MQKLEKKIKFERGLHAKQVESFQNPDGVLFPLKEVLKNPDYQIEFRDDYLNIYYKGGNILLVKGLGLTKKSFDINYCNNSKTKYKSQIKEILETQNLSAAIKHLNYFAYEMDCFLSEKNKKEREEQHRICIENRRDINDVYVVDIEYAATGYGRADILAVRYDDQSQKYKVYIIEFKQGNGSISSGLKIEGGNVKAANKSGGFKAGIYKHYVDALSLVSEPIARTALLNTVRNSIYTRKLLGIADFPHADKLEDIFFDDEIEMRFVLSNYKEQSLGRDVLTRELGAVEIKRKESINENGSGLKWDKVFIPAGAFKLQV